MSRIRSLDGLRGVAILLVLFHNQSAKYPSLHLSGLFANGWMGVDLFFVLSGFLITGILLDAKSSPDYFRNFYARRCLRIWPLYYSILAFMFVVVPHLRPSDAHDIFARSSPWWSYLLFLQNLVVPNAMGAAGPLGVTWSLAVEEQFYFVWPWIVRYASEAQTRRVTIGLICLSPVIRFLLLRAGVDLYPNTFSRLDGLMAGAFLALLVRSGQLARVRFTGVAWAVFATTLPLAFVLEASDARWLVYSLSTLASASLVYLTVSGEGSWLQKVFSNRSLVYTGTISYGLYLLHKIPFDAMNDLGWDVHPFVVFVSGFVACYAMAALSWTLLEQPCLRLKRFFEPHATTTRHQAVVAVAGQL